MIRADKEGVWDRPMYSQAMAARMVDLHPSRVTRWLKGYEYTYRAGDEEHRGHQEPIVDRAGSKGSGYASFLDLVDLLFVRSFLEHGISLQKLRNALKEANRLLDGHHFAQRSFFTDGHRIYLELKEKEEEGEALMELLSGGQWVIAPVIKSVAKQIVFDETTGYARRWYPQGPDQPVVVDPGISFGDPTLRGISIANIHDLFVAEDGDLDAVAEWFEIEPREARKAIEYQETLMAA